MLTAMRCTVCLFLILFLAPLPAQGKSSQQKLTLAQAIKIGSEQNFSLLVDKLEQTRYHSLAVAAREPYVPALAFTLNYGPESAYTIAQDPDQILAYGTSLHWLSPIGSEIKAGLSIEQHLEGKISPEHRADVQFSFNQHLLKNGWRAGASTPLLEAELQYQLQRELVRARLNQLLVDIEAAFWSLAYAEDDVIIKTRSRDRAQTQFNDTQENIRRGILAQGEIYVVEENLVYFEQELLQSKENHIIASRNLARLLQLPADEPLEAIHDLNQSLITTPSAQRAIYQGLDKNPDLNAQRLDLERLKVRLAYEQNQALPLLDLQASFTLNGLSQEYRDMWTELRLGNRPEFRGGLLFEIPLSASATKARIQAAQLQIKQKLLQLKEAEDRLRCVIANWVTQIEQGLTQQKWAQQRVRLGELKLSNEQEKYRNGISTLADVVRFQRELDQTLISLKQIQTNLRKNHSQLLAAQGVLATFRGVWLR